MTIPKSYFLTFFIAMILFGGLMGCGSVNTNTTVTDGTGSGTSGNGSGNGSGSGTGSNGSGSGNNSSSSNSITVQDKSFTTDSNQDLQINLSTLVNEVDSKKSYTYSIVSTSTIGVLAIQNELITYSPLEIGSDEITYKVSDGTSDSNIGKITIVVKPFVSGVSVLVLNDKTLLTSQNEVATLDLSSIVKNFDSKSTYNFVIASAPTLGTVKISGLTLTYTPDEDVIGNDQISLRAGDGNSTSNIATIDIQVQDPSSSAPVLNNVEFTVEPNISSVLNLNLLFKAPHPFPNKNYTFTILQQGKLGTGVISGRDLTYTPILNALNSVDRSMRILVEDDLGQKSETNITINITN